MKRRVDNAQTRSPIGKRSKAAKKSAPGSEETPISKDLNPERSSTASKVSTSGTEGKPKESGSKKSASNSIKAKFNIDQQVLGHSLKYNQLFDAKVLRMSDGKGQIKK